MTSSLSGERRWASARRSGMTVLGKVVVPKPINLPSQRLENHGLDPNVEIVPKGSHSWGSKSTSSSNAWGSSLLSPCTDGGIGSPSHLSGRPSFGSGNCPSTASSDRAHEFAAGACGPNSRPASASGVLTTNQTSLASLRPRSAETRPGSSQLSRFSEPSEHLVACSATVTAEKLGVTPPRRDGFSLSSGDFPTLGSGKDNSGRNDPQDQSYLGHPGSSSGGMGEVKERIETPAGSCDVTFSANVKNCPGNSWKRDDPQYSDDGGRPGIDRCQGNPQAYSHANVPPQYFDAWHGTPMNNPQGGVWFRGPLGGPPYGRPVGPGGFPMDPFSYYHPQIPANGVTALQPVPPPGSGPRGHHPKNGDMYRPHMPEPYIHPGMPIKSGYHPGPVAYEGYYGPPMGYCSSNERDIPFVGMPASPSIYNRYSSQGPMPGNAHGRSTEHGSISQRLMGQQVESGYPQDNQGPYKVLLKQRDSWDRKMEEQRDEGGVSSNVLHLEMDQSRNSSWENDWRADKQKFGRRDLRKAAFEEPSRQNFGNRGAFPAKVDSPRSVVNVKANDETSVTKIDSEDLDLSKAPEALLAASKDSSLIQKIEGLNAKAHAFEGRSDVATASSGEEQNNKAHVKDDHAMDEAGTINPASHEGDISGGDKNLNSTNAVRTAVTRRSEHGFQARADHHGRGRFDIQEGESWRKKPSISEFDSLVVASNLETSNDHLNDHLTPVEAKERMWPHDHEEESGPPKSCLRENQAQQAKMRQLARQRAKQLQEEEGERIRMQMAKSQAKLEELNRHKLDVEGSTQRLENVSSSASQKKQEEIQAPDASSKSVSRFGPEKSVLGSKPNAVAQINEGASNNTENPPISYVEQPLGTSKRDCGEIRFMHDCSLPLQQEVKCASAVQHNSHLQMHGSQGSKHKDTGFKQRLPNPSEKTSISTSVSECGVHEASSKQVDAADNITVSIGVAANEILSSSELVLPQNSIANTDPSFHARKKNNRCSKYRHKMGDASSDAALPPSLTNENAVSISIGIDKTKASGFELDTSLWHSHNISKDVNLSSEHDSSLLNEESNCRVKSQWKHQQSRRLPKYSQVNRPTEKHNGNDAVVWAPVRSQTKAEAADEVSSKNTVDATNPPVKSDQVQNGSKNKRAEIERYIPKPVAKEMAQLGSNHRQGPSLTNQTTETQSGSAETPEHSAIAVEKVGIASESRNVGTRRNKQGKTNGSWRQRRSTEWTSTQDLQDGFSCASNVGQNLQKSKDHHDVYLAKEQPEGVNEWKTFDGCGAPKNSDSLESFSLKLVKVQGTTARGERHLLKGQKGMGTNHNPDEKKNYSVDGDNVDSDNVHSASDSSQTYPDVAFKENGGSVECSMSYWQPKKQAYSSNRRVNRHNGGQNAGAEVDHMNKKESGSQDGAPLPVIQDKNTDAYVVQHYHGQSAPEVRNSGVSNLAHEESKRGRKVAVLKGHSHPPNQVALNTVESEPPNSDIKHEQLVSLGFCKRGNQNSHYGRGQDSHRDWNNHAQDNKKHNSHANQEKPRHLSPCEWPHNNKSNICEGPKDATNNAGGKGGTRGQSHSRRGRGSFYGRSSGATRVDAGYD